MEVDKLIEFFQDTKNVRPPTIEQLKRENYETGLYAWYSDLSLVQKAGIEISPGPWHIDDRILLYVGMISERKSCMTKRLGFHACRGRADQSAVCKRFGCLLAGALKISLHQVLGQAKQFFWSPRNTLPTWVLDHLYFKACPCNCGKALEPEIVSTLIPLLNRDYKPLSDFDKLMASLEDFHTDLARRNPRPLEKLK
jgi:hypothetical protein